MREAEKTQTQLFDELEALHQRVAQLEAEKQTGNTWQEDEEIHHFLVENQSDLICRYRPDTTLTFVNDAYCRYFGQSREALLGTRFLLLLPVDAREAACQHVASLLSHPRITVNEHPVLLPSGETMWQEWLDYVQLNAEGQVEELVAIGRDITVRKQIEAQLQEASKLAAVGRMAAAVAHEINNPLASIQSAFRLIKDIIPLNHPHAEFSERIDAEITRIARIVKQMYSLYQPGHVTASEFSLKTVIQDVIELLNYNCYKQNINITTEMLSDTLIIYMSENFLRQVLSILWTEFRPPLR